MLRHPIRGVRLAFDHLSNPTTVRNTRCDWSVQTVTYVQARFGEIQTPALISIFGKKCVPNGHEIRNIKRMRLFYEKSEILILQSSLVLPYNFNCHSSLSNIYLQS